jgi:hypothetical protein
VLYTAGAGCHASKMKQVVAGSSMFGQAIPSSGGLPASLSEMLDSHQERSLSNRINERQCRQLSSMQSLYSCSGPINPQIQSKKRPPGSYQYAVSFWKPARSDTVPRHLVFCGKPRASP